MYAFTETEQKNAYLYEVVFEFIRWYYFTWCTFCLNVRYFEYGENWQFVWRKVKNDLIQHTHRHNPMHDFLIVDKNFYRFSEQVLYIKFHQFVFYQSCYHVTSSHFYWFKKFERMGTKKISITFLKKVIKVINIS